MGVIPGILSYRRQYCTRNLSDDINNVQVTTFRQCLQKFFLISTADDWQSYTWLLLLFFLMHFLSIVFDSGNQECKPRQRIIPIEHLLPDVIEPKFLRSLFKSIGR